MKVIRIGLWGSFAISLLFYIEALLTDYVYSNCINVGTLALSCTNHAGFLYPLVGPVSRGYLLGSLATPSGMGQVAGVGFIGAVVSILFLQAGKQKLNGILDALILASTLYIFAFVGFLVFLPFCVTYQCRVTNYLSFISYDQALIIAAIVLCAGMLGKFYLIIKAKPAISQSLPNQTLEETS